MSRPQPPRLVPPPDLYGRPRPDRYLQALDWLASKYVPLFTGKDRYGTRPRPPETHPQELTVVSREPVADDVVSLRLATGDRRLLPRWQPGAHLDLILPSGRRRQYSLCGDPADRYAYRIAVRLLPDGQGGSAEVHRELTAGSTVGIRGPRNAFPFAGDRKVLLLAGGIGLTPVLPMAREAAWRGLDWHLVHTGRSRASLPFAGEVARLAARHPGRVTVLTDDEHGMPSATDLLARAGEGTAVYCCGPVPMLDAVQAAFARSEAKALHFERFSAAPIVDGKPFTLRLRDGRELLVPADRTALEVLRADDPGTPYSCQQGFCGVCKLRVLSGTVDHRDRKLSAQQRADGEMLVCVSRAAEGECLELDV
ncbi:PDR/VanB family oxidoreductase [Streptomyces physcomitrii]|uniref:Oxidoreductase n=1 Tax=Streptomyces physcomitrii TaxID=2724184 RepID=A0ABX1H5W7_9ACTN|nr:PDR/VanB family oxidoreductase [Streptomyces physcomitrii]NKI42690.1 oxidoreductase [Streptomyces physcomitrii]